MTNSFWFLVFFTLFGAPTASATHTFRVAQGFECKEGVLFYHGKKYRDSKLSVNVCGPSTIRISKKYSFSWDKNSKEVVALPISKKGKTKRYSLGSQKIPKDLVGDEYLEKVFKEAHWKTYQSCGAKVVIGHSIPDIGFNNIVVDVERSKQYPLGGRGVKTPTPKGFVGADAQSGHLFPVGFNRGCSLLTVYITDGAFETFDYSNGQFLTSHSAKK